MELPLVIVIILTRKKIYLYFVLLNISIKAGNPSTFISKKRHNILNFKKFQIFFKISISKPFSGTGKPSTGKIISLLTGFRKMKFHRTKINLINFKILIFLKFLAGIKKNSRLILMLILMYNFSSNQNFNDLILYS